MTITRIGRRTGSICSTYVLNREINTISFYTKEDGVIIITTNNGWLCGENKNYNDFNRLDEFFVNGEITNHNANTDVEKRMKKGGNFTINIPKETYDFEPKCNLYIEIDNNYVKLIDVSNYQELYISEFSYEAKTMFYKRAVLQVCTSLKDFPICMGTTYIQEHVGSRGENTNDVKENLDKMNGILRDNSIYFIDKSALAQLLNKFDLVLKTETVIDTLTKRIKASHSDEVYGEQTLHLLTKCSNI